MRALIVDTRDARASLAAVRALARGGWTTGVATDRRSGLAALSRHAQRRHPVPSPDGRPDAFVEALAAATSGYDVVFASSDAEILALSRARDRLDARVPYPPHEALLRAIDKLELERAARSAGIATPPSTTTAAEALRRWPGQRLIVKERLHGTPVPGAAPTHLPPALVDTAADLERRVDEITVAGGSPLVQPAVQGRLMAFASVVDQEGRMLARVQQIAERTYPTDIGLSVRARTVAVDDALAARVAALLADLGWVGLSQLQFLAGDGEPQLIDFNGRFYGSLSLALAAGVNLADVWARAATGRRVQPVADARAGVRYQWLEGDLRATREDPDAGARDVAGCLVYAARAHHSIASARDPLPAVRVALELARTAAAKAVRR